MKSSRSVLSTGSNRSTKSMKVPKDRVEGQCEPLHTSKPHAPWLEAAIWALAYDDARKLERSVMKDVRNRDGELELDPGKIETQIHHVGMYEHVLIQKFFGGDPFWKKDFPQEDGSTVTRYGRRGFRMADGPLEKHEIHDTMLHLCAKNNKPECMRLLLRFGVRQDVYNKTGRTAKSCAGKDTECSKIFAEELKRRRDEQHKHQMEEAKEAGIVHVPQTQKSDALLAAEEHNFESLEIGDHIQVDYTDNPDQKAAEHVYYFLRRLDVHLPERANVVIAFGCEDHRVAERCYELYDQGYTKKIIITGGVKLDPEKQMPISERLKIHLVSKGVPPEAILTEVHANGIHDGVQAALKTLSGEKTGNKNQMSQAYSDFHSEFHCPRYDMFIVAAPYQQRRAWLTCQKQMPAWVWLHNAAIHETEIDHGVEIDISWRVDEAYYQLHYGKNTRELCLEEMGTLIEYESLGYCAEDPSRQHEDIKKDYAVLRARVMILDHFEEKAFMVKRQQMFASA